MLYKLVVAPGLPGGGLACGGGGLGRCFCGCGGDDGGGAVDVVVDEVGGSGARPPATLFSLSSYWQQEPYRKPSVHVPRCFPSSLMHSHTNMHVPRSLMAFSHDFGLIFRPLASEMTENVNTRTGRIGVVPLVSANRHRTPLGFLAVGRRGGSYPLRSGPGLVASRQRCPSGVI